MELLSLRMIDRAAASVCLFVLAFWLNSLRFWGNSWKVVDICAVLASLYPCRFVFEFENC
jgi:hypothetical protein